MEQPCAPTGGLWEHPPRPGPREEKRGTLWSVAPQGLPVRSRELALEPDEEQPPAAEAPDVGVEAGIPGASPQAFGTHPPGCY